MIVPFGMLGVPKGSLLQDDIYCQIYERNKFQLKQYVNAVNEFMSPLVRPLLISPSAIGDP